MEIRPNISQPEGIGAIVLGLPMQEILMAVIRSRPSSQVPQSAVTPRKSINYERIGRLRDLAIAAANRNMHDDAIGNLVLMEAEASREHYDGTQISRLLADTYHSMALAYRQRAAQCDKVENEAAKEFDRLANRCEILEDLNYTRSIS